MTDRCELCGGNAGRLNDKGEHNFCRARKNSGMDTPSLGDKCPKCKGNGRIPKYKTGISIFFEAPENVTKALEAWAPECKECDGTGIEYEQKGKGSK